MKEIEKKYLIETIPSELKLENSKEIHQTYLAIGKEEIRVRKILKDGNESHTMTIKKGHGLTREEIEFEISKETYEQLLVCGSRKPLIKTRGKLVIGENIFDFDVYQNSAITNLKTIEIEFNSEEDASCFIKPEWFGTDVTEDKRYKNQSLWKEIQ
jgi:adenylate cyclase